MPFYLVLMYYRVHWAFRNFFHFFTTTIFWTPNVYELQVNVAIIKNKLNFLTLKTHNSIRHPSSRNALHIIFEWLSSAFFIMYFLNNHSCLFRLLRFFITCLFLFFLHVWSVNLSSCSINVIVSLDVQVLYRLLPVVFPSHLHFIYCLVCVTIVALKFNFSLHNDLISKLLHSFNIAIVYSFI